MSDPAVPLLLALYGHPDSGGHWEEHCDYHLVSKGWTPIPEWKSCYWHPQLQLVLNVYVDDFKLAGPKKNLAKGWELLRKNIQMEQPQRIGSEGTQFLGCRQIIGSHKDR